MKYVGTLADPKNRRRLTHSTLATSACEVAIEDAVIHEAENRTHTSVPCTTPNNTYSVSVQDCPIGNPHSGVAGSSPRPKDHPKASIERAQSEAKSSPFQGQPSERLGKISPTVPPKVRTSRASTRLQYSPASPSPQASSFPYNADRSPSLSSAR